MSESQCTLQMSSLGDVLALTRSALGQIPENSLVVVGLYDGMTGGHMRVDLDPVLAAPRSMAESIAITITLDKSTYPEAVVILFLDQKGKVGESTMDDVSDGLTASFKNREVLIAHEHRVTDDRIWPALLADSLDRHPGLVGVGRTAPADEAAHWVAASSEGDIEFREFDDVADIAEQVLELVTRTTPDWQAIVLTDEKLQQLLGKSEAGAKLAALGLKALIEHAKGHGALSSELLKLAFAEGPASPILRVIEVQTRGVHRFATIREHSYSYWMNELNR